MKTHFLLFIACILSCVGLTAQDIQKNQGTLSLFIRDQSTGLGLPATVQFSGAVERVSLVSSIGGKLDFQSKPGKYILNITAKDHQPMQTFFTLENGRRLTVDVWMDGPQPAALIDPELTFNKAVVQGYVTSRQSGLALEGIHVASSSSGISVTTDRNGYFRFESSVFSDLAENDKTPVTTDLTFSGAGFGNHIIRHFLLLPGIYTLPLALNEGNSEVLENFRNGVLDKVREQLPTAETGLVPEEIKADRSASTQGGCPILPANIRVGTGCSCTSCPTVSVMTLEKYVGSGIDDEWISSWMAASLEAGAVAYRSYGAYYAGHPVNTNFDIASSTCNQAWGAATATSCVNAAAATAGEVLTVGLGGPLARSEYAAEQNNYSACGDAKTGNGTTAWPCQSDAVCAGSTFNGHGRGMCQWGSQRWAQNSQTYTQILDHYYNIGNEYRCSLSTGLNENKEPAVQVYPNPSEGLITISGLETGSAVSVYDAWGRLVYTLITTTASPHIDLSKQAQGLYFYNVTLNQHVKAQGKILLR